MITSFWAFRLFAAAVFGALVFGCEVFELSGMNLISYSDPKFVFGLHAVDRIGAWCCRGRLRMFLGFGSAL